MGADICSGFAVTVVICYGCYGWCFGGDNRIGLLWTGDWCWNRSCYEDD
ncbi:BnaA10g10210D [Brassica napus]|uniref:BnaA10g10210D protein n=1 Tax=Brassica napus TaxID=3708 RepID=A0A078FXB6_BRANA|nr:BnaA10g10210D [Brassica napus]